MKIHFHIPTLAQIRNRWSLSTLLIFAMMLASCSEQAGKSEKIIIRGSNTFGEELAALLIAEFKKQNGSVDFDSEFKGTSYGLGALMVGNCDIAAASRPVTTNELALAPSHDVEFNDYVIGSYAVEVVVNAGNGVGNLTTDQVRDIFTGVIENWKEVGGMDAPIHLHIRNPMSGTYLGFQELAMEKKPYGSHVKSFTDYKSIEQAVAADPNGIGFSSIESGTHTGVKSLAIGGISPTAELINQGTYPYARVLRLYTNKSAQRPQVAAFVQFVQSAAGKKIASDLGYVPKP